MNILLGCNHLHELGGSEQHLYTLAEEFTRLNHNVYVLLGNFTLKGKMSQQLKEKLNIEVDVMPTNTNFDAVFLSHKSTIKRFIKEVYTKSDLKFNDKNIYQICHGIFSDLEYPHPCSLLNYIAISEEVEISVRNKISDSQEVYKILNPINTNHFYPIGSNKKIKNVYSLSQNDNFNLQIKDICNFLGFTFKKNNKHTNPVNDIRDNLKNADLVFSLGRGCYEAMAMGKNVIIADSRGYMSDSLMDGLVNSDNFKSFIKNNCSGRNLKKQISTTNIIKEIDKYSLENCQSNRKLIIENFDSKKIANDLLNLIK
tara:strand:- start:433 stop:1371 length:939 start_codon:yes stop_codon:yes gene_type:complete